MFTKLKRILLITVVSIIFFVLMCRSIFRMIKKKKKKELGANNKIFLKNNWNNYQYFQFKINDKSSLANSKKKITRKIKKWEQQQIWFSNCNSSIFKLIRSSSQNMCNYLQNLVNKKVPKYNGNIIPYLIIFFKNEYRIGCFLSHYYCDGQIFLSFLNLMSNTSQQINFLKYSYIPIFSDIKIFKYIVDTLKSKKYTNKKMILSEKSSIYLLRKKIDLNFKRYDVYSYIFDVIFKYIPLNKLKVAFTVGIDDPYSNHNRIGVITRVITRQKNILNYKILLKKKLQNSLDEALICYDILKNFPVHILRAGFNNNIDIVFTSFRFNSYPENDNNLCQFEFSSFLGSGKMPIYINSITKQQELLVSLKISTSNFHSKKFISNEDCQLLYTFKSIDKMSIFYRRYIHYRNKYLMYKKKEIEKTKRKEKKMKKIKRKEKKMKKIKRKEKKMKKRKKRKEI